MLTALVSNTPSNAIHMVFVLECGVAKEMPDVEVLQLDTGWRKANKKLHIILKKPIGLPVAMFGQ